jgi:hypothetical protein
VKRRFDVWEEDNIIALILLILGICSFKNSLNLLWGPHRSLVP